MGDPKLKAFIDRVLHSREREDAEKSNTKEIYAELAADGYDKTIVGKVVNHLRKDQNKAREQSEVFDLYLAAYLGPSHVHTRVREAKAAGADPITGEFPATTEGGDHETADRSEPAEVKLDRRRQDDAQEGHSAHDMEVRTRPVNSAEEPGRRLASVETPTGSDIPATISEPASPLPEIAATGDRGAVVPSAALVVGNVLQLRTHNPDTHFLNSAGLQRLHGCLKAELCGSSEPRKRLCFDCSRLHEGPAHQDGAA